MKAKRRSTPFSYVIDDKFPYVQWSNVHQGQNNDDEPNCNIPNGANPHTVKIKNWFNKLHIDNQLNLVGIPIGNVIIRTFQPNEKGNVLDLTFKSKFEILKFVFRFGSLICKSDHWFKFNNFRFITHHFGMGLDGLWYYINSPRAAYINYLEI